MHTRSAMDENAAFEAQLMDRIGEMIECVILETVFNLLGNFLDNKKNQRPPVCYRSDCKRRDEIPF